MPEKNVVHNTSTPLTVLSLTEELRTCGLVEGQTVLVHMAMSKLGWVIGGAEAVILALLGVKSSQTPNVCTREVQLEQ